MKTRGIGVSNNTFILPRTPHSWRIELHVYSSPHARGVPPATRHILCFLKTINTCHSITKPHIGTPVQRKYRKVLNSRNVRCGTGVPPMMPRNVDNGMIHFQIL